MTQGFTPAHVAVAAVIGGLGVLAWTATRSVGPVPGRQGPLTELEAPAQNFAEHLAHISELTEAVFTPHRFPDRTCPGITQTIHQGFAPRYALSDPQIAALPAEEPW